ncbi:polymorphic toxin-type HINT domain-containing protein [Streptomyces sp. NBC_01727]|uniref:polymorphic toxin-type HINT domain-containing protein n=1 Tax=Streptomyces sp. NBC_01727 TaxID=2975924 RepID=UPI002E1308BD|nr:polymorphic toxin-type HINT domain-containing protein [Streptomyces sp. NBC_01727]
MRVTVDYSTFRYAYGGNFASRLRLVALPACALTTPKVKGCSPDHPKYVPVTNDVARNMITATVQADGDPDVGVSLIEPGGSGSSGFEASPTPAASSSGMVYALASGSSSEAGDYRATSLKPSGSWNVSTGSGAFTYDLPVQVPEPPMGSAPALSLAYNSQSVDSMTSAQNTQADRAGLGWDLSGFGFIERRYRGCQDDGTGNGTVGDLCWASPNYAAEPDGAVYVLHLNGVNSLLVQDDTGTGSYHVKDDPGWRVQHLWGGHGTDDEYWAVSTQEGARYYFGWGRSERTNAATDSVLTVPVFGNNPNEPGYDNVNKAIGVTTQAYRWGLDRVVDANEVETAYFYEKEQNQYRSVLLADTARVYDSAAYPVRIEYGWASQVPGAQLPAKVDLRYVGRCVERMAEMDPLSHEPVACPAISSTPGSYPDVPTDLMCDGTNGCRSITGETYSPTFFDTKMLWDIKTFVRDNDTASWDPAMQYQMKYGLPNPSGTIDSTLWLDYVQRKGYGDGTDITLPTININGEWRDNQLGGSTLNFRRVTQIHGDLGSFVNVTYRDYDDQDACVAANPPTESNNTQACFKQRWVPEGATQETTGWFKKYVVSKVSVDPGPGAGAGNDGDPVMTTTYDYVGKPAWAFPNDPLTKDENESWTEWRGYQQTEVHTGTKSNAASTYYWLYRGMDGDRTSKTDPTATRSVTVDDGDSGNPAVSDHAWLAGKVLETSNRDGSGQSHKRVWHTYWSYNTAQYEGLPDARFVRNSETTTDELTSSGWREHTVKDEYDTAEPASTKYGLPMRTNDWGVSGDNTDNRCTTYGRAYNTDLFPDSDVQRWTVLPDETRHYAADCAAADRLSKQDSYTVTLYDNATSVDTNKPSDGNPTAVRSYTDATHYRESKAGFDQAGRQTSATDGKQNTTTTTFQPATSWPVNGVSVTSPDPDGAEPAAPETTTTWYSRLWGGPTRIQDANNQTLRFVLDSVGRLSQVFKPSNFAAYPAGTPSVQYDYTLTMSDNSEGVPDLISTVPPKVSTKTLLETGKTQTTFEYFDGLGRSRETQGPAPTGTGRTAVSTRYDTSGNVTGSSAAFYNSGVAGSGMVLPTVAVLPSYTDQTIDYAGRTTESQITMNGAPQAQGQTITNYHGDYTTTVPAAGERTNTYTDVFGQTNRVVEFGPSTYSTNYEYTGSGKLAKITDAKGNITTYTYNWLGERTGGKDPDADPNGVAATTYDDNGNVETVKDANGTTLTYTYDTLNRPLTVQNGTTVLTRDTYDTAPGGIGQLATSTSYAGSNAYTTAVNSYDADGNATETQTTIPADGTGFQGTYKTGFAYNAAGQQTRITYPAVGDLPKEIVTTQYDAFGNPEKVSSDLNNTVYVDSTGFDSLGRLKDRTYGTTATTGNTAQRLYSYDDANGTGWLKNITSTTSAQGTVQNDDYLRDNAGQTTDLTDRVTGQHQCFTYDELNRLSQAWTSSVTSGCIGPFTPDLTTGADPYQIDYTYDGIGNLQKVTNTTTSSTSDRDYAYPGYSADESTYTPGAPRPHAVATVKTPTGSDTYAYDNAGQMKTRTVDGAKTDFTWNALHQVTATSGAGATGYIYDASGTLLIRTSPDENVLYLPGQEVHKATGAPTAKATRYYSEGTSTVASRTAVAQTSLTWIMSDDQNSTQLSIDASTGTAQRRHYLPFGAQRGSTKLPAGTDRGFLGKTEDDTTGLSILGARMYDPKLSRFLSPDPITTPYQPQNLSAYSYTSNNPITYSDPSGLFQQTPSAGGDGPPSKKHHKSSGGGSGPLVVDGITIPSKKVLAAMPYNAFGGSYGQMLSRWAQAKCYARDGVEAFCDTAERAGLVSTESENDPWGIKATYHCLTGRGDCGEAIVSDVITLMTLGWGSIEKGLVEGGAEKAFASSVARAAAAKSEEAAAARLLKSACSFSPSTPVLLKNRKTKPIGSVKPGDEVAAADPDTGKRKGSRTVTARLVHHDDDLVDVTIRNTDGHTSILHTTSRHPFWDDTLHTWIPAAKLKHGHALNTATDGHVAVVAVKDRPGSADMYNLTVNDLHTYYVLAGETPVLVHNSNCEGPILTTPQSNQVLERLGYTATKDKSAGRGAAKIWKNKKAPASERYVTQDMTGHGGGLYKAGPTVESLQTTRSTLRSGSYELDASGGLKWLRP